MSYTPTGYIPSGYTPGRSTAKSGPSEREIRAELYRRELDRREREGKPSSELSRDEQLFRVEMANIETDRQMREFGMLGNKERAERAAVSSVVDEMGTAGRLSASLAHGITENTYKLSGLAGMNTGEGSFSYATKRMGQEATSRSSGLAEDLLVGAGSYVLDPVWMATYGAGRIGMTGQFGKATTLKSEIARDVVAGVSADIFASAIRHDGDSTKMLQDTGLGVGGAIVGNLAMRGVGLGIGAAWKKAFPGKPLPKNAEDAVKILDKESPGWRKPKDEVPSAEPKVDELKPKPKKKEAPSRADILSEREDALRAAINDLDTPAAASTASQKALPSPPAAKATPDPDTPPPGVRDEKAPSARRPSDQSPEFKREVAELEADGMTRQEAEELLDIGIVEPPAATRVERPIDKMLFDAWRQKMEKLPAVDVARKLMGGVKDSLTDLEVRELGALRDILMGKARTAKELDTILLRAGGVRRPGDAAAKAMHDRLTALARAGILEPPTPPGATKGRPRSPKERGHAQILSDTVSAGVKAGEWSVKHTVSGAKWALSAAGDAIKTMRDFAQLMIGQFGRGVRKHIPDMWKRFKRFVQERNTSRRRSFGGGDFRPGRKDPTEGVSKTAKEKLRAEGRAEAKRAAASDRKTRAEFRDKAVKAVKSAFPIEKGKAVANKESRAARGEYLKRVVEAETEAKVRQVLDDALRRATTMAKRARSSETIKSLHKSFFSQPIYKKQASKNKEFLAKLDDLKHAGIKNPRRGPTVSELADMTPEMRKAVVDYYNDSLNAFRAERATHSIKPRIDKAAADITRELKSSGRKAYKTEGGASRPRDAGFIRQFFREMQLQPESLASAAGEATRKAVYEKISDAYTAFKGRSQSLADEFRAGLRELGVKDPTSKRFINSISGTKAPKVYVDIGGETVEMNKGNFLTLVGYSLDSKTRATMLKGRPVVMPHDPTKVFTIADAESVLKAASDLDIKIVRLFMDMINRRGAKGKWPSIRDAKDDLWKRLYGRDLTSQDDLFPRMVRRGNDTDIADGADEILGLTKGSATPENMAMAKARVDDTQSALVLGDFLTLVDRYFTRSSALVEMTAPVKEVRGVLGKSDVKDTMDIYMGSQYHNELNAYVDRVAAESILHRSTSLADQNWGKKALHNLNVGLLGGLSIPVSAKQFASIYGAMYEGISPGQLSSGIKTAFSFGSKERADLIDRMMEHPIMRARLEGHASRLTGEMRGSVGALGDKLNLKSGVLSTTQEQFEKTMGLISWMDTNTVGSIWRAVEIKIASDFPGLKKSNPALYKEKVHRKAYEVIRRTQPNFDIVDVSSVQATSRENFTKHAVSMFMSPRNTEYNILYRAVRSKDPKKIAIALATVGIAAPATVTLIDEIRDTAYGRQDDDDLAEFGESVAWSTAANNIGRVYYAGPILQWATGGIEKTVTGRGGYLGTPSSPLSSTGTQAAIGVNKFVSGIADGDHDKAASGFASAAMSISHLFGVPARPAVQQGKFLLETGEKTLEELGAKEGDGFGN